MGSGLPDPATAPAAAAPIPQTAFENKPAPGQTGPKGLAGRQTFSRVNTGTPPTPDAGQSQQKSMAPLGAGFLPKTAQLETFMTTTAMPRPTLHDFLKTAMAASAAKVDLSLESARQVAGTGDVLPGSTKTAAAQSHEVPTEYIDKLASALNYVARSINPKLAEGTTEAGPGQGPNALETNKSGLPTGDGVLEAGQSGQSTQAPSLAPATAKLPGQKDDPGNTMETNVAMTHKEQPVEPIANEKTSAAYWNNLLAVGLAKVATAPNGQLYIAPIHETSKQAFSLTNAGHNYDAAMAGTKRDAAEGQLAAGQQYRAESPMGLLATDPLKELGQRVTARKENYVAQQHAKGENAYNPLGGLLTATPAEQAKMGGVLGALGGAALGTVGGPAGMLAGGYAGHKAQQSLGGKSAAPAARNASKVCPGAG